MQTLIHPVTGIRTAVTRILSLQRCMEYQVADVSAIVRSQWSEELAAAVGIRNVGHLIDRIRAFRKINRSSTLVISARRGKNTCYQSTGVACGIAARVGL